VQLDPTNETFHDIGDADVAEPFNVVIAYGDVPAGRRAMRLLASITDAFASGIDLHPQAWRLDLLEDPTYRVFASADVIGADMLIVSISSDAQLSPIIKSWITACLARKRGEAGAVVALARCKDRWGTPITPHLEFLKRAAEEAQLAFFSALPRDRDSFETSIEDIRRRTEMVTPTLDEILHRQHRGSI
jgi:hypothetical protein